MNTTTARSEIDAFLASERLALVGVARDPQEFGHRLYTDLRQWGYGAVPVNPNAETIGNDRCYSRLQDIQPGVESVLLLTAPKLSEQIVHDCAAAGVRRVWFYGVGDRSNENVQAIAYCMQQGIRVIPGFCPYMFLPRAAFFHKLHGFFARLTGGYPH